MISIEEMETLLEEISAKLPQDLYKNLNGGILLLPEAKMHEKSRGGGLYVMGEYNHGGPMGRFIAIYYGSFKNVYGSLSKEHLRLQVEKTLKHEFRHHLESMAGDKSLERKDAMDIENYLRNTPGPWP